MTAVRAIDVHVVDPPARRATLDAVRGGKQAVADLGAWPEDAGLDEMLAAELRAGDAVHACLKLWHRYCRRHGMLGAPIENRAPVRLLARYLVSAGEAERRAELLRLLVGEPEGRA